MKSPWFEVNCHPAWRPARTNERTIILLPDGNHRKHAAESYRSGAENVVACAERLARRGDISRLLVCVVSRQNVERRPQSFFHGIKMEFDRLRADIEAGGKLRRSGIRCRARGDLPRLRSMGGPLAALVASVEAACNETQRVIRPCMELEFWLDYPDELVWEQDADLVVRTGAEEVDAIRPGLWLPPGVPCMVTTSLWPDASPEDIERLVDEGFAGRPPHFAPGYELAFVVDLLRSLPAAGIPAPFRLTLPVCAAPEDVTTMLDATYAKHADVQRVFASYEPSPGHELRAVGPRDEAWYALRLVPGTQWCEWSSRTFDAVLIPGQTWPKAYLGIRAAKAPVHTCAASVEGVLEGLCHVVRYPVEHIMLGGASRSIAPSLSVNAPFPANLMELMALAARRPHIAAEDMARSRMPPGANASDERERLVESVSAKVLSAALVDGLLLRDGPLRQADRNYAFTGAYMMLRVPDEANPSGEAWEPAAELAIRCMLTLSTGDNGIFDRVLEGETPGAWRARLEAAARYLGAVARGEAEAEPPTGPGSNIAGAVGRQWQSILERHTNANPAVIAACRHALARHYRANLDEYEPESASSSLVQRLRIGGLPRRDAIRRIETLYASTAPFPVAERLRALVRADVHEPRSFAELMRELELLLRIVETSSGMGIEVLFSFCALPTPTEFVTPERLEALLELARLADHAFRLANDMASLLDSGEDRDRQKRSCVSGIIPKGGSASSHAAARDAAKRLGEATLAWLYDHLGHAVARIRMSWPSMAEKVQRAMFIGRGVYERGHYATLTSNEMMNIIESAAFALAPAQPASLEAFALAKTHRDRRSA